MTAKNKQYVSPVTAGHIQHVLSLELSMCNILMPELVNHDKDYFNMLDKKTEEENPKTVSPEDLVFQRKSGDFFLPADAVFKEVNNMVKKHLKNCNSVLMYVVSKRKSKECVMLSVKKVQDVFDNFKEHEFPEEHMRFELIKLSIIEETGFKQGIRC